MGDVAGAEIWVTNHASGIVTKINPGCGSDLCLKSTVLVGSARTDGRHHAGASG